MTLTAYLFGLTCGLFLGFLLGGLFGPAAPLALAAPLGIYVICRSAASVRRRSDG